SQTRPPSVDRPAATAAAMSARPSVIMVSRDLRAGLSSPATWMPGSGRSHAKGAAPSGSHDGGTGGPYGAPGPEPGSWDGPWAAPGWSAPSGPPPYPAPGARGADTSAQPTGGSGERRYRPYQPASIAAVMRNPAPSRKVWPEPPKVGAEMRTTTTSATAVSLEPDARPRPMSASPLETSSPAARSSSHISAYRNTPAPPQSAVMTNATRTSTGSMP